MKVHHTASGWSFNITPTLDRGWGYDPYIANLVGRIRAGRPALPCLWDANSLFLGSGRVAKPHRYAAKMREITAEEMAAYRAEQEKRRLAMEAVWAQQAADRAAKKAEAKRVEREWAKRKAEIARKAHEADSGWRAADPDPTPAPRRTCGIVRFGGPKEAGMGRIPQPGWWREQGNDVILATMLFGDNDSDVLVGPEGAGMWVPKFMIKEAKDHFGGLYELRFEGEFAKRMGFCNGKPTKWLSP